MEKGGSSLGVAGAGVPSDLQSKVGLWIGRISRLSRVTSVFLAL